MTKKKTQDVVTAESYSASGSYQLPSSAVIDNLRSKLDAVCELHSPRRVGSRVVCNECTIDEGGEWGRDAEVPWPCATVLLVESR